MIATLRSKLGNIARGVISLDLLATIGSQLWRLISGPATLLLLPLFLSANAQGYWYTFISFTGLFFLADLGFSTIVLQYAAHEFAHLRIDHGHLSGREENLIRLGAVFQLSIRWICMVVWVVALVVFLTGIPFFSARTEGVEWFIPWIIYVSAAAITLTNNLILSFFQGLGLVARCQFLGFVGAIVNTLVVVLLIVFKFDLYALAVSAIAGASLITCLLLISFRRTLSQLLHIKANRAVLPLKDFFRLLGRYAVSSLSGYLLSQIYTPIMFIFQGSDAAGRVGISLNLWMAVSSVSSVWLTVSAPKLNALIAIGDWKGLDRLHRRITLLSVGTFLTAVAAGTIVCAVILLNLAVLQKVIARFMDPVAMLILGLAFLFQTYTNCLALYLRSHKEEPLLIVSIVGAVTTAVLTICLVRYFSPSFYFLGYLLVSLGGLFWIRVIFDRRRRKHELPV